ncbi:uncharacterized protein LOC133795781 [Humulus lupulus]|uniref:uncharacterized protein LOC133795781 n=1 Tax=Humulus lupulus TaxID=3486 RepID=UPI002B403154|nr:uncharacterized protein LOC133795781 [Humulus lupulus]
MEKVQFDDVIHYKDNFYGITCEGEVASFDLENPHLKMVASRVSNEEEDEDEEEEFCGKYYLVECCGQLLQIKRYLANTCSDFIRLTSGFKVFKLSHNRGDKWVEMESLGHDVAIFLGDNSSVSVLAPNIDGYKGNCLYFTEDKDTLDIGYLGPSDMGLYDFENKSFTRHFDMDATNFLNLQKRPLWILPTLHLC